MPQLKFWKVSPHSKSFYNIYIHFIVLTYFEKMACLFQTMWEWKHIGFGGSVVENHDSLSNQIYMHFQAMGIANCEFTGPSSTLHSHGSHGTAMLRICPPSAVDTAVDQCLCLAPEPVSETNRWGKEPPETMVVCSGFTHILKSEYMGVS